MAELIAGLYEKNGEIGSGGGGVVYLGRHIRLDKVVVLKADKRVLKSDERTLRREVDLLKELSQTYIPQVYDFVREDDAVYTVMDYIEGESLDKLIKRGERPPQGKVIKWACQLLEALDYLHTRPPHGILHGDIKPANIMLRPNGDICLIDYNIALALGEDGAVKVGFSRGYASPEHYGYTYVSERRAKGHKKLREKDEDKTLLLTDDDKTVILKSPVSRSSFSGGSGSSGSGSQSSGGVLLDVR
ncbi:MAG: protein kinase [Butyrivibrio sp.]|nr:protein kinase [Butyrivibrio sp.]